MAEILPNYSPSANLTNAGTTILIAGCGTGKQAAQIARSFPHASVLAVDLSRASLAYASYKASQYNLKNIDFLHADILDLSQLTRRFDVIICTGVLHHMSAIEPGWRILRDLLNPNGVMQIAVYSRLARQDITEIRQIIAENNVSANLEGIRAVRDLVFAGQLPNVSKSRDFYSTSNCRDLLFHVQEICSDIPDLQHMLASLELEFLGFDLLRMQSDLVKSASTIYSLTDWQQFEEQHPSCFEAMYHLWCTPKKSI
jgi:ubiquinone/menaquinone biosynthesis C-methylase UbiE